MNPYIPFLETLSPEQLDQFSSALYDVKQNRRYARINRGDYPLPTDEEVQLYKEVSKIEGIKAYRARTGKDLILARDVMELYTAPAVNAHERRCYLNGKARSMDAAVSSYSARTHMPKPLVERVFAMRYDEEIADHLTKEFLVMEDIRARNRQEAEEYRQMVDHDSE